MHTVRKREFFHIAAENITLWTYIKVICILHILHRCNYNGKSISVDCLALNDKDAQRN